MSNKTIDAQLIKKYRFILEACEYKRHFLHLDADDTIVTNISCDHLDYFKDEKDYAQAFIQQFQKTKNDIFMSPRDLEYLTRNSSLEEEKNIKNRIQKVETKKYNFNKIFGEWNNINASLLETFFTHKKVISPDIFQQKVIDFSGLRRRMEYVGNTKN